MHFQGFKRNKAIKIAISFKIFQHFISRVLVIFSRCICYELIWLSFLKIDDIFDNLMNVDNFSLGSICCRPFLVFLVFLVAFYSIYLTI